MSDQNPTKAELQEENEQLKAANDAFEDRLARMEELIAQQQAAGEYTGPEPVVYNDPFDAGTNPHHFKKHPDGMVLSWKNPNLRNDKAKGWRGWVPVTYDSEIGQNLSEYLSDPPMKMAGIAEQDNYVRRGTDSILCTLPEEIWKARQLKREEKALRKQQAAAVNRNQVLRPGVSTTGDGVQTESRPVGGFKVRENAPPIVTDGPSHRTELFDKE
jgi:hypothetical protein